MAINLYGYNTNRITGLFSGMDTQSLVNNMMQLEQLKVDKIYQQREKAIWKNEAYTDINTQVNNLRNTFLSALGEKSMVKSGTYNAFTVNMAQNSAINITSTSGATATSFSISSIEKATAARVSSNADSRGTSISTEGNAFMRATATSSKAMPETMTKNSKISDFAKHFGLESDEKLAFSINGETFTFDQTRTIDSMMSEINGRANADATMSFENGKFTLTSDTLGKDSKLQLSNISGKAFSGADSGFGITSSTVKRESVINDKTTLKDLEKLGMKLSGSSGNDVKFKINDEEFTFSKDETVYEMLDKVNNKLKEKNIKVEFTYSEQTGSFRLKNTDGSRNSIKVDGEMFSTGIFELSNGEKEITRTDPIKRTDTIATVADKLGTELNGDKLTVIINGGVFNFDAKTTTLNSMMNEINNSADAKAVFTFSEMTDTFSVESLDTGTEGAISRIWGLEDIFDIKNVDTPIYGENAKITLDDGTANGKVIEQSSNTFELDGLRFEITGNFKAETTKDNINVNVTRDYGTTIDAVKGFVEEYNKLIEQLNTLYTDKANRDYPPLTDEQRAQLSEKEQEQWDEKAKAGILRNDPAIGSLLTNLRTQLYAKVAGTGLSPADIGLSTVSWNSSSWKTDQGKIQLDESKLRAALEENPNAVQDVLTKIGYDEKGDVDTSIDNTGMSRSGLLTSFSEYMSSFSTKMKTQNIMQSQEQVDSYTTKISDMLNKMAQKEERYWMQYSQMETMLAQMQSQQDWLTAQLGMSNKA